MVRIKVDNSSRLGSFLCSKLEKSRSKIQDMIKKGNIRVNDNIVKSSYVVKVDDIIDVDDVSEEIVSVNPEKMDLDIVYEDSDVIVVNKANGVVVHPACGNSNGTLVNGLMFYSDSLSSVNGEFRPGIVHRIDAYTTGLLMVAKNDFSHESLARQLELKTTRRIYWALVWGVIPNDSGRCSSDRKKMAVTSVNSKHAVTHFRVLERYKRATLIELSLETGRTHQIRVHMSYIGYPIVNDPVYGKRKIIDETGQCLHAKVLGFKHPRTGEEMVFDSELPECFTNILNMFKEE